MNPFSKTFAVFFWVFSSIILGSAQSIEFQPLNGPNGIQNISAISSDNAGRLFMISSNEIFRSVDNGNSWTECMSGISLAGSYFQKFLLSPSGTLYAHFEYSDATLYRYIPASDSWAGVPLPFDKYDINGIDIDTQGRIWVSTDASYNKIHYSVNGGASFQQIPLSGTIDGWYDFLETWDNNHNLIAVGFGTSQKIFHFTAGGQLQQVYAGSSVQFMDYNPNSGTAYFSSYDDFKRSTDGGLTWQEITLVPGQSYQNIYKMMFEAGGKTWVQSNTGTYRSEDDGITWSKDIDLSAIGGDFFLINDSDWFVTNPCGYPNFGRSENGGATWTDLSSQFFDPYVYRIEVDGLGSIYAQTCKRNAYERSTDNGQSWADLVITDSAMVYVQSLASRSDGTLMAVGDNGKCYRSVNNGSSWEHLSNLNLQIPNQYYHYFYTDPYGAFYLFGLTGEVFKSVDSGNSWQPINFWPGIVEYGPAFHPNGDIYVSDYGNGQVYVASGDSTKYLEMANEPYVNIYSLHCTNRGITFLVVSTFSGASGLYKILPDGNYTLEPVYSFDDNSGISAITSNTA